MSDQLVKFILGAGQVRGVLVRLESTWAELQKRRSYPQGVAALVGQMAAASALMAGSLKFDGSLILQIQGDGPLKLAVAECQPDFGLRATAKMAGDIPDDAVLPSELQALVNLHGQGRCAITLDPRDRQSGMQPYQGIVALTDAQGQTLPSLAAMLEQYLAQSEQIDSLLRLASGEQTVCGLLLQRMPAAGQGASSVETAQEAFSRARHLAATLTSQELLELPPEDILRRLFWDDDVRVFEPLSPRFHCTCSRERVAGMLRLLGREEVSAILAERGEIDVRCEFCGQGYAFDAVDAAQVFVDTVAQPPVASRPH
ncbi:Hsp33 family molecular chaperone HslO [Thiomonas sp.]|uniref:Hsp33 family molecular chaperone HslO n=1 Tax=Thiomonas sp. TaxID=2047785 RepID=UPI002614BC20|nr:Hsp33 family molecular chaperone HslO [Thiomonas sp.]